MRLHFFFILTSMLGGRVLSNEIQRRPKFSKKNWTQLDENTLMMENKEVADEATADIVQSELFSKCGQRNVSGDKVVGGEEVVMNSLPWNVYLKRRSGGQYCGGSLISAKHILTAAHCVTPGQSSLESIVSLGDHHKFSTNEVDSITRNIRWMKIHSKYDESSKDFDIALLELDKPVKFDFKIRPLCLADPDWDESDHIDQDVLVSGWGHTAEGGPGSNVLLATNVSLITTDQCQENYEGMTITENMVCAGVPEGGYDSCQGDSGGPLIQYNGETAEWKQVGIVSWGLGCAQPQHPGVYVKVAKLLDWINLNMGMGEQEETVQEENEEEEEVSGMTPE